MNNFFFDNFILSSIELCVYVAKNAGVPVHKNRPSHGFVLELSGRKKYLFEGRKSLTVRAGDVFYLPKGSTYEVIDEEEGDCIAVNFQISNVKAVYPFFSLSPASDSRYSNEFFALLRAWEVRKDGYMNHCFAALYTIICQIQQDGAQRYVQTKTKRQMQEVAERIHLHLSDNTLSVAKLAKTLSITPEYFRKLFKIVFGISPKRYIAEQRIKRAKELLSSREFSVGEVGERCGYNSASYFCREFKEFAGITPSDFLKSNASIHA